jgi:hypothetical protein
MRWLRRAKLMMKIFGPALGNKHKEVNKSLNLIQTNNTKLWMIIRKEQPARILM